MKQEVLKEVREVFSREANAIEAIPVDNTYEEVVETLFTHVHERGGKLIASGMGKAGHVANHMATTLSSTGTPSLFLHPSEAQHGDLGIIRKNDVLLVLSNSGKTREILELVELTHALHPDVPVIVITGDPEGELARKSAFVLYTGNPVEVCSLGLTPTTSATAMAVIGDALVVLMMNRIGFTARDYALRHHGGYLGQKSRNQQDEGQ